MKYIPEDPTSANNANIRQRAQKTMTLVRFLKCHQIWATFILSDFMVNCLSDNATRSRFTASHFFTYCQCPTCGWTIRSIHRMTILNSSEDPGHWLRCASTSVIYATQTASSPTKKCLPMLFRYTKILWVFRANDFITPMKSSSA